MANIWSISADGAVSTRIAGRKLGELANPTTPNCNINILKLPTNKT